ncbi:MAG: ATP-binding protein [Anaeromyxobacter sp.]
MAVVYLRGPELVVEHANAAARAISPGVDPVGMPVREVPGWNVRRFERELVRLLRGERVELRDVDLAPGPEGARRHFTVALDPVLDAEGRVEGALGVAFETTGAVRAEARADLFARMVSELAADPDLGAVARNSLTRAVELLGGVDGTVWLKEEDHLRCVYESPEAGRLGHAIPLSAAPILARAIERGQPETLTVEQAPPAVRSWLERLGLEAAIALPLAAEPAPVGVFVVADRVARARSGADVSFGRAVAAQCALAIQRARASRAERVTRERLQKSQRLTAALAATRTPADVVAAILDDGLGAFGAAAGVVTLLDPQDGGQLRAVGWRGYPDAQVRAHQVLPLTAPLPIARAAAERRAQWLGTDTERKAAYPGWDRGDLIDAVAWACLPLLVEDRCLGVVGLAFREEQTFPADLRDEMVSHIRKCAQALERVQLDEALARERLHLSAILDALPAGVSVADASGRVIIVNATALAQAGPGEQLLGRSALAAVPVGAAHPDGRPVLAAELPLARALAGERVEREEVRVPVPGGRFRALSLSAAPLREGDGTISGAVEAAWDVTAQKETEGALRTATVALDVANRQKDQFLAMLAHELRNPLAAIRSAAHVIRGRAADGRDSSRAVGILERQAGNASRILDDLLDVSRITRGLVELRKERVQLDDVVASAVESQRGLADSLSHRLTVRLAPGLEIDGDPTRLEQIVANLLNNAVKYSPPGGSITVELAAEGGRAVLRVSDRGSGIPPELLPRVFELFVQGERGLARTSGGLGLGLTLVKRLVELHGGEVSARSDGAGLGSTFEVRLPLAARAQAPAPRHTPVPAGSRRVLVVEDNADAAETLVEVLKLLGHEARWAPDGPAALALAERFAPDVVLLDIGLPEMDGYEVARRLRASARGETLQIVAVSGYGQLEDQERARAAGFDLHLTKPVEPASLARAVGRVPEPQRAPH